MQQDGEGRHGDRPHDGTRGHGGDRRQPSGKQHGLEQLGVGHSLDEHGVAHSPFVQQLCCSIFLSTWQDMCPGRQPHLNCQYKQIVMLT